MTEDFRNAIKAAIARVEAIPNAMNIRGETIWSEFQCDIVKHELTELLVDSMVGRLDGEKENQEA